MNLSFKWSELPTAAETLVSLLHAVKMSCGEFVVFLYYFWHIWAPSLHTVGNCPEASRHLRCPSEAAETEPQPSSANRVRASLFSLVFKILQLSSPSRNSQSCNRNNQRKFNKSQWILHNLVTLFIHHNLSANWIYTLYCLWTPHMDDTLKLLMLCGVTVFFLCKTCTKRQLIGPLRTRIEEM